MKITKDQQADIDAQAAKLTAARKAFDDAVTVYNEQVERARVALDEAHEAIEMEVTSMNEVIADVAREQREAWEARSEKWQDSDKGQAADEWIGGLESIEVEVPELPEAEPLDFSEYVCEETFGDDFAWESN